MALLVQVAAAPFASLFTPPLELSLSLAPRIASASAPCLPSVREPRQVNLARLRPQHLQPHKSENMSSSLIPRRMAAVVSSRPMSSMVAVGQDFQCSQRSEFLRHHNVPQIKTHRDQSPTSRGLAHYTKGGTSSTEQQQRQQHNKKMKSLEQASYNQKHQEHLQTGHLQHQTRRTSTTQAHQLSGTVAEAAINSDKDSVDKTYSVTASQKVFNETVEDWAHSSFCPETRLRTAVEKFRDRFFVDELPCRTRKSVAEAAAAGKGYITAGDISRVFETISDEKNLLTEDEAHAIIHAAWSRYGMGNGESREDRGRGGGREEGTLDGESRDTRFKSTAQTGRSLKDEATEAAGTQISTEEFILVLEPKNPAQSK